MALLETDIEIFINRAQQKIATLGDSMLVLDLNGQCVDYDISLIEELSAAVELFQNCCCTPDENLSYKVIGYLNDKANLSVLPLVLFDNNCLVDAVLLPSGGFVSGPTGPPGLSATISIGTVTALPPNSTPIINNSGTPSTAVFNFGIPEGNDGTDGADGNNGWSPIYAAVQDGLRYVLELIGWTGGTGSAPTTVGVYIGPTGYVSDIANAVDIRGLQGINGTNGDNGFDGWTPVFSIIIDGQRTVLQVSSWIGGSGTPPDSGQYISSSGFTTDITAAIDIRGAQGVKGDPFNINASGLLSDRNAYDNEGTGFTYLATDTGDVYIKNSPLPGDWGPPISFVGDRGWSPVLNTVVIGERVVLQVSDWVGGEGPKPPIGGYIGQSGFTNDTSDATDIRGEQGEFFINAEGPVSDRTAYDDQGRPFTYYATDTGQIYFKNSDAPADWTVGFDFRGERGPAGPAGSVGPAGEGLTLWNSTTNYLAGETVLWAGLLWLCITDNNNDSPGSDSSWSIYVTNTAVYGSAWNGSVQSPTQGAVYTEIEFVKSLIVDSTTLDATYLRLDTSNNPLTNDLDLGTHKILNVTFIRDPSGNNVIDLVDGAANFLGNVQIGSPGNPNSMLFGGDNIIDYAGVVAWSTYNRTMADTSNKVIGNFNNRTNIASDGTTITLDWSDPTTLKTAIDFNLSDNSTALYIGTKNAAGSGRLYFVPGSGLGGSGAQWNFEYYNSIANAYQLIGVIS